MRRTIEIETLAAISLAGYLKLRRRIARGLLPKIVFDCSDRKRISIEALNRLQDIVSRYGNESKKIHLTRVTVELQVFLEFSNMSGSITVIHSDKSHWPFTPYVVAGQPSDSRNSLKAA